jgi:hypothetical protein
MHKCLAGAKARYRTFMQGLSCLQAVCLVPDGSLAHGLCMGSLFEVVQRSPDSFFPGTGAEHCELQNISTPRGQLISLANFKKMGLCISPAQLHDASFMKKRLQQVLLSVEGQLSLKKAIDQQRGMHLSLFTRALHKVGGDSAGPLAAGMLPPGTPEFWAEAVCGKSDAVQSLFGIAQRTGLLSLLDLRRAVENVRQRSRDCGFVPTGNSATQCPPAGKLSRPGMLLFREALSEKGIRPLEGAKKMWPELTAVPKMRLKGDAKDKAEHDALLSWVEHVDATNPGFRGAVQLARDAGVKLVTIYRHWWAWASGKLSADNWPE